MPSGRIIAHMTVEPEDEEFFELSIQSALAWCDVLHICFNMRCSESMKDLASSYTPRVTHVYALRGKDIPETHFRDVAWNFMTNMVQPMAWEYVACIEPDEFVHEPHVTKALIREHMNTGSALAARVYHMWTEKEYRVDSMWRPSLELFAFPYVKAGQFPLAEMSGRVPSYVYTLPKEYNPVAEILSYHFMPPDTRKLYVPYSFKEEYQESLGIEPVLEEWTKGGLVHASTGSFE